MKITHVTTRALRTPADNPLVVGLPAPTDTREFVTLELGTDQGAVGIGLTFFGGALTPALKTAVDELARLTVGEDPTQVEAITGPLDHITISPATPLRVRTRSRSLRNSCSTTTGTSRPASSGAIHR